MSDDDAVTPEDEAIALLTNALRKAITEAERKQVEADRARTVVERYQRAIGVLEGHEPAQKTTVRLSTESAPATMVAAATRVLADTGRPMHVREISERLAAAGYGNGDAVTIQKSLRRTLNRKAEDGKIFFKAGPPATFSLISWRKAEEDDPF